MNHNKYWHPLLILFLLSISWLLSGCSQSSGDNSGDSKKGSGTPPPVEAMVMKPVNLQQVISVTGSVMPDEEVMLSPERAGKIKTIHFTEGDNVKQGALLVELDASEEKAQRASLQHQLGLAEANLERQKDMLEADGVSREAYEESQTRVQTLRAEISRVNALIRQKQIRAPFDGQTGLRRFSEGSYVAPSDNITKLVKYDPVKISFSVPEEYANRIPLGGTVQVRTATQDSGFKAKIYATDPSVSVDTRVMDVRARTPNPSGTIVPGSHASVEMPLKVYKDALMIPTIALIPGMKEDRVFLYKNGKVSSKVVTKGVRKPDSLQITSGLSPGDTVITAGIMKVNPGMEVTLKKVH